MSPLLLGVGEEGQSNVTLLASSATMDPICPTSSELKERNYMGLSDCSSMDSSTISYTSEENNDCLNLKATELRLGLPGSKSPERDPKICLVSSTKFDEKQLFPLHPLKDDMFLCSQKTVILRNKRGFSDAMNEFSEGEFHANSEVNALLSPRPFPSMDLKTGALKEKMLAQPTKMKDLVPQTAVNDKPHVASKTNSNRHSAENNDTGTPATNRAQVVGWPPIRSYRKNTLASSSKQPEEVDGKPMSDALFVKVSMDGAPYLRKVDLRTYPAYQDLSSALEKMFSCFTIGQYGSHESGHGMLSESKLKDLLHSSEYVLTYEDKDGDWMLVGDVPWEMFTSTCKRLRIMKSSDAIGLAPRAVEKCRKAWHLTSR